MKSTTPIFLDDPEQIVYIFGKKFTAKEIKDEIIDARILKGRLNELIGGK